MSVPDAGRKGPMVILVLAVILGLLHQDLWWWDDPTLVLGFLPTGLAFHITFSLLAASLWALAVRIAWPHHLEDEVAAEAPVGPGPGPASTASGSVTFGNEREDAS